MAGVRARDKLSLVVGLHQATAVCAKALRTDSGAGLTGNQLHAISEVDDPAGGARDYANEGGGDGSVLHVEGWFVGSGIDGWSGGLRRCLMLG